MATTRLQRRLLRRMTSLLLVVSLLLQLLLLAASAASFVSPTRGSAHALTLSTVVTDAAELHFAVVASGHAPLDARAIKSAAEQCSATNGQQQQQQQQLPPQPPTTTTRSDLAEVVAASTVPVAKAKKVERCISGLQPNTSYDVYFVAEVSGSNGVFGPVQSVLRSTTHPEPSVVELTAIRAANASATALEVNATLSAPGRVYLAFVPSAEVDQLLLRDVSPTDLVTNRSLSQLPTVFVLLDEAAWTQLAVHKVVEGLTSATLYDVLVVSEALGGGDVRSNVTRLAAAARTHALPPDVTRLACAPQDASAEELVVDYELAFDARDVARANAENLPFFAFTMHYAAARVASPPPFDALGSAPDAADEVRGTFAFGNFSSVEQLREQLATPQRGVISGLLNGTSYRVTLVAETTSSHGLIGSEMRTSLPSTTHERAPQILSANAAAANGSVTSLVVTAELARAGNVHYLVAPRTSVSVRHNFRDAPSMAHLAGLVQRDEPEFVSGVIPLDSAAIAASSGAAYTSTFAVAGLRDATAYTVVLMPETYGSRGVFGKPFEQLLEAQTNENASEVALHAAAPVGGSTTSVELTVEMSKPSDVLFYCLATELPLLASKSACLEADKETFRQLARGGNGANAGASPAFGSGATFAFAVANLTEDTVYFASVFAENARRNDVLSAVSSPTLEVKTHKRAPAIASVAVQPVAASVDRVAASVVAAERCLVHYAIIETPPAVEGDVPPPADSDSDSAAVGDELPSPETIVKEKWTTVASSTPPSPRRVEFVGHGRVFAATATERFGAAKLNANTTYTVFVTTETSLDGNASGVYGDVRATRVTTFAAAPKILKATADPVADRTDRVFVSANLSAPGVVHYFLSDVDFADPAAIRHHDDGVAAPHTLRGEFYVSREDMAMERINGTNDSQPVQPLVFVSNVSVGELRSGATYHVSLTTETHGSGGVFGDFPPPILVTTHLAAPTLTHLAVAPTAGSSSSIAIELELSRFGEVHYALFFRELVRDHSNAILEERRRLQQEEVAQQETDAAAPINATEPHVWPPVASDYELANLNASLLKAAPFDVLGRGVWENGTVSVSRDDVATGRRSVKEIKGLPPNAVFDVCLVSETAGSDGVFDWGGSGRACHRVKTHADYSNQSSLLDDISVQPVDGQTGSVRIELTMSKLPGAPSRVFQSTDDGDVASVNATELLRRFKVAAGRTPYFILADAKEARKDFASNSFSPRNVHGPERFAAGFREAAAGSNGVAAAGVLATVRRENASFVTLTREVRGLQPNHPYLLFFAYETSGSGGVFTKVNPHKLRPNASSGENDGLEVATHEAAPALTKFAAVPTFGNTTRVTVKFDVVCASCKRALVHALVYPESCALPSMDLLRGGPPISTESETEDGAAAEVESGEDEVESGEDEDESDAVSEREADGCRAPLAKRTFVVEMRDREHKMLNVERDIVARRLRANSTYTVFLATETAGSNGVLSDWFVETAVTTFAPAPAFKYVRVAPRKGSTTELVFEFELETPGEVHYMCGVSGNPELNVTSPYNVSRKSRPEKNTPKLHDYARDVVRTVRSVRVGRGGAKHVEVLDYLVAGTNYNLFVVAEAPESNGVYGPVLEFPAVATHANPPILLAHAAHPTPGSKASLLVGFRVDAPGAVHFSVVETTHWRRTQLVAGASGVYGNRLAVQEELVAKESVVVDAESIAAAAARDSGWREVNISVPRPGANYTVYLVTETAASDGVFGTVASHRDVRSHGEPPTVLKLAVTTTDARVDALTGSVQLTDAGHVHYIVLPHRRRLSERDAGVVAQGVVDVTVSSGSSPSSSSSSRERSGGAGEKVKEEEEDGGGEKQRVYSAEFVIEHLTEGTVFDVYFRCETLHSFGVFSSWTHFPISARTHGLPPDVLEEVECVVSPSCDSLGREMCTRTPNVCGECREGFAGASGSSNEACIPTEDGGHSAKRKRGATIKISGVRVNPLAWLEPELPAESGELESQTPPQEQQQHQRQEEEEEVEQEPEPLDSRWELPDQDPPTQADSEHSRSPIETIKHSIGAEGATDRNETQQHGKQQQQEEDEAIEGSTAEVDGASQQPRSSSEAREDVLVVADEVEQPSSSSADPNAAIETKSPHTTALDDRSTDEDASDGAEDPTPSMEAREDVDSGITACPLHAHLVVPGECACIRGFERNELTGGCELLPERAELSSPAQRPFALEASA